jgi:hypothetical protein
VADVSTAKMRVFDACEDVFVLLAHDPRLFEVLPLFNKAGLEGAIGGWKKEGWKERTRWKFLGQLPRDGKMGKEKIVEGFWRGGRKVSVEEALAKDGGC